MKRNPPGLTARQSEVLELLARGKSTKEIGDALHISPRTVEFHLERMKRKLGAKGQAELGAYAWRHGLAGHSKGHAVLLNKLGALRDLLIEALRSALQWNPELSQAEACHALLAELEKLCAAKLPETPAPIKSQLFEAAVEKMALCMEKMPLVFLEAKSNSWDAVFHRSGLSDAVS